MLTDTNHAGACGLTDREIRVLDHAVEHWLAVRVTYRSQRNMHEGPDAHSSRVISPQGVDENRNLAAYCHLENELRTFRFDRIRSVSPHGWEVPAGVAADTGDGPDAAGAVAQTITPDGLQDLLGAGGFEVLRTEDGGCRVIWDRRDGCYRSAQGRTVAEALASAQRYDA